MKKNIALFFLGVFLLSLTAFPGTGQSVEDILQKMIQNQGGKKTLESIEDTTMSGTIELAQMGLSGTITVYKKEPEKRRVDVEVMGMLITQAYDGAMAWWVNPQTGATESKKIRSQPCPQRHRTNRRKRSFYPGANLF